MISRKQILGVAALCLAMIAPAWPLRAPDAFAAWQGRQRRRGSDAPGESGTQAGRESFDRYQVLLSNNIFIRDRAGWRPPGDLTPRTPLSPEEATALRGIVRQGEGPDAAYFVFLEDVRTQQTTELRVGDPVCAGKLVKPTLESVEYVKNGVSRRIEVGQNLTGKLAMVPAPPAETEQPWRRGGPGGEGGYGPQFAPQGPGLSAPAVGSSPASTRPALSPQAIAEQMRQKRLRDLGK